MTIRLAVLASGGGTTLQNLMDRVDAGRLIAAIELVIASSASAGALERARSAGIRVIVVPTHGRTVDDYSREIFDHCQDQKIELVVLGGYLKLLRIPDDFAGRVMNIHPALIPAFCGKGFYGMNVHREVLRRGVKLTGCTVHFADNQYDHGPIILQRSVPVFEDDIPESLAKRVFDAECEAYPEAIRLFAEGRLDIDGARVRVRDQVPKGETETV